MTLPTLAALLLSTIPILLLCIGDPKRLRAADRKGGGMTTARRRTLSALACVPGLACALVGDAAAFLMWLGGCAMIGWAATFCFRAGRADGIS